MWYIVYTCLDETELGHQLADGHGGLRLTQVIIPGALSEVVVVNVEDLLSLNDVYEQVC